MADERYPDRGNELLNQARASIENEADPFQKTLMYSASISAGDTIADYSTIFGAYSLIGEVDYKRGNIYSPLWKKVDAGQALVSALSENSRFDDAYSISQDVFRLNRQSGIKAMGTVISAGYYGPDNELQHLLPPRYLEIDDECDEGRSRKYNTEIWLEALAKSGVDISAPDTRASLLLGSLDKSEPDTKQRQRRLKNFAIAAAKGRNIDLAREFMSKLTIPEFAGEAIIGVCQSVDELNEQNGNAVQVRLFDTLVADMQGRDQEFGINGDSVKLGFAYFEARSGHNSLARKLAETADNNYSPYEFMKVYTELYRTEGLESDRDACKNKLAVLRDWNESALSPFIIAVALADLKHGKTIPSLSANEETVPLLAWEVGSIFNLTDDYSPDSVFYREMDEKKCRRQRSNAYAELAVMMAQNGAPDSAEQFLTMIEDPVYKVGADTGVGLSLIGQA